jgi:glycosyltransferase involved in cell wall biosynthesis
MKIVQLLPVYTHGDAISNETLYLHRELTKAGITSFILPGTTDVLSGEMPFIDREELKSLTDTVIIYHYSIGDAYTNSIFLNHSGKKGLIYHNITPSHYFRPFSPLHFQVTQQGRESLKNWKSDSNFVLADSNFNANEMRELGYSNVVCFPIHIDFSHFGIERVPIQDGYINFLFTGRLAPNKRQEDVIRVFNIYHNYIDRRSRLYLVGNTTVPLYKDRLLQLVDQYRLDNSVSFQVLQVQR